MYAVGINYRQHQLIDELWHFWCRKNCYLHEPLSFGPFNIANHLVWFIKLTLLCKFTIVDSIEYLLKINFTLKLFEMLWNRVSISNWSLTICCILWDQLCFCVYLFFSHSVYFSLVFVFFFHSFNVFGFLFGFYLLFGLSQILAQFHNKFVSHFKWVSSISNFI